MLEELLALLRARPRTVRELLQLLNASAGQVESALVQLRRGGYVDLAQPEQGSCRSGCGHCSVKSFCPSCWRRINHIRMPPCTRRRSGCCGSGARKMRSRK